MGYSNYSEEHLRPWCPPVDVHKAEHEYMIQADIPGLSIEEILVKAKGNTLSISGERPFDPGGAEVEEHLRLERLHGRFVCEVHLPGNLKGDNLKVGYHEGVLTVTVPTE